MENLYDVLFVPNNTDMNYILLRGLFTHENTLKCFESDFNDVKMLTTPEEITSVTSEITVVIDGERTFWDVIFIEAYEFNKPEIEFTVKLSFSDAIISDTEMNEVASNLLTGIIEQANTAGIAPEAGEVFTTQVEVAKDGKRIVHHKF